jgi:hypothetical protein
VIPVKITRLYKSLAALIILFFFVFGAFAVSLANESPTIGVFHNDYLRLSLKDAPAQVSGGYAKFQLVPGDVVTSALADVDRFRLPGLRFNAPGETVPIARIHVPKVSLQILQSILLL